MFWSYTNKYKYSLRVKHDISEAINIFTSEDVENMPPESRMWFRMNFTSSLFRVKHSCQYIIKTIIISNLQNYTFKCLKIRFIAALYCGKTCWIGQSKFRWNNKNHFFAPSFAYFFCSMCRFFTLVLSKSVFRLHMHFNGGSMFLTRTLYPKDLIIGAVTLVCTFVLFGIAQSWEQRIAKLKSQYPSLVPIAVIAVAVLIIYALGSILVFIWGVTVPLAGIYHYNIIGYSDK